jgi:hypothetical protein
LVLEQKIVLTGYRKSYPRNLKMFFEFDLKITISMLKNLFTIGLRANKVLTGYGKSCPRNLKMYSNLTFDPNFKVKLRLFCCF